MEALVADPLGHVSKRLSEVGAAAKAFASTPEGIGEIGAYLATFWLTKKVSPRLAGRRLAKAEELAGEARRNAPNKGEVPDWLKKRFAEGEAFNKANRPRYKFNEVEVTIDGKKFRVDSYNPGKEIVSRRLTQFSEIQEKTAVGYFNEFTRKYAAGAEITNSPFNPKGLRGDRLRGDLIFEVPVQANPISQGVLDAATSRGITIRDVTGKVYN